MEAAIHALCSISNFGLLAAVSRIAAILPSDLAQSGHSAWVRDQRLASLKIASPIQDQRRTAAAKEASHTLEVSTA